MKRILTLCLLSLALCASLTAQNPIFRKYADMDEVKYVSIGQSMLQQMAQSGKSTIGGIDIRGLGPDTPLTNILIISSSQATVTKQIEADEQALLDAHYANLSIVKDGKQSRSAIYFHEDTQTTNRKNRRNELVMFVTDGPEMTVIVLNGSFSQREVERMFL